MHGSGGVQLVQRRPHDIGRDAAPPGVDTRDLATAEVSQQHGNAVGCLDHQGEVGGRGHRRVRVRRLVQRAIETRHGATVDLMDAGQGLGADVRRDDRTIPANGPRVVVDRAADIERGVGPCTHATVAIGEDPLGREVALVDASVGQHTHALDYFRKSGTSRSSPASSKTMVRGCCTGRFGGSGVTGISALSEDADCFAATAAARGVSSAMRLVTG